MSDESDREHIDQLLADFASGEISGVDARLLESRLAKDPALRDELRAILRLDGHLRALAAERVSERPDAVDVLMRQIEARNDDDPGLLAKIERRIRTPIPRMSVAQRRARSRRRRGGLLIAGVVAVAAAALLVATLDLASSGSGGGALSPRVIALEGDARVIRDGQASPARVAAWVRPGDNVECSVDGGVGLRYGDGTGLSLGGGAVLEVVAGTKSKSLALRAGSLSADVAPQPPGLPLVARTSQCVVRVIGTRLELTAGPEESLVSVEEGSVHVYRVADGATVTVSAGQYAIVGPGGGSLVVVPVGTREEEHVMKATDMARALGGAALALTVGVASAQGVSLKLEPVGAVYDLVEVDAPREGGKPEAVTLRVKVTNSAAHPTSGEVELTASDIFDRQVAWRARVAVDVPAGQTVSKDVEMRTGWGFYTVYAKLGEAAGESEIGVVPPHRSGIRKDSFFASNTSGLKRGDDLRLLQRIGMKVQRAHFQPHVKNNATRKPPTGGPLPLDLEGKAREFENAKAHETWVLPLTGYAFGGAKSELANLAGMHGPPRDFDEWVKSWELIVRRFPEIEAYEFWNEPWIFGWTWAAPPEDYRKLQSMWCRMALKVNPKLRIIAGNSSMFTYDHIEPYPESWQGLINGTTHHPYCTSTSRPTFRSGESMRSIDEGMETTRRMGLDYYYLTEGGTWYKPVNSIQNARKIVQYHVQTALTGCFQANAQFGIGIGRGWTRSNQAYAVMTHFLEDRPVVAEIWPENELLWGAVFAPSRHATSRVRALPRARELQARWKVDVPKERAGDATKVAVLWSFTGESCDKIDTDGTLTIEDASGLAAYDMTGRAIEPRDGALVIPFTEDPVYVTTDALDVVGLRNRIANARIERVTPVNVYALSLERPGSEEQTLSVRVENQLNCTVNGVLHLQVAGESSESTSSFAIAGGALQEVEIAWPGVKRSAHRQYAAQLVAECRRFLRDGGDRRAVDIGVVSREQLIQTARFVRKTVRIDGTLRDWEGVTPVVLDSRALKKDLDTTRYLLNPHLARVTGEEVEKRVVARVYTAYDDRNVYVAAAVNEATHSCSAGQPSRRGKADLPYRTGMPDGLTHITLCGDVFSFAFGFRDRVPGYGRQMDDPWRWKGMIRDTDYHYVAHTSTDGDMLVRQWGADTDRRNAYQCDDIPHVGPVRGARVKITRDEGEKLTIYEIAIPRGELRLFDPAQKRCRFAFILYNDEKVGGGSMHWTEAAGVFDHWRNSGSFAPSWNYVLPCQTVFAIDR